MGMELRQGMALALLGLSVVTPASAQTCRPPTLASLDKAIATTVATIKSNDAPGLLQSFSPEGVLFSIEGEAVSLKNLSEQFAAKSGRYCDLFTCKGRTGVLRRKFLGTKINRQLDAKHGLASVFINANSTDELDLSYKFTRHCTWVLSGIAAP